MLYRLITGIHKPTHMVLKCVKDRVMITIVVSIPMTVEVPMIVRLAISAEKLNIDHELHFGLQLPPFVGSQ